MAYWLKDAFDRELSVWKKFDNKHCNQITKNLYLNDKMADIFFLFGEGDVQVPAHKLILVEGSDVFNAMFCGALQEKAEVKIVDASIDSFKEFLQFFYLGKVTLSFDNVADVMNLANKYMVPECCNVCDEFLKHLPVKDLCFTYELALTFDRCELLEFCEQEIRINAEEVLQSDSFLKCSSNLLQLILRMNYLDCHEIDVFNGCLLWASYACVKADKDPSIMINRRDQLGDCLRLIQFSLMNKKTIYDCVHTYKDLFNKDEVVELFDIVMSKSDDKYVALKIFDRDTRKLCCDIEYETPNFPDNHSDSTDSLLSEVEGINKLEVTQFFTNKKVILKAIETSYIDIYSEPNDLSATVSVVTRSSNYCLSKQQVQFFLNKDPDGCQINAYCKLVGSGLTIQPYIPYEIRIELKSFGNENEEDHRSQLSVTNADIDISADFKVVAEGGIVYMFHFNNVK